MVSFVENKGQVSVIVPVYNVEKYLSECVDSLLNQTYQNFEIILVDDGSKDGSSDICDAYGAKDNRIRSIHKENGGASTARNVGLDIATGEFVFFLDSDDWLERTTLEKLLAPMKDEEIEVTFCEAYAVDEDTGEVSMQNYGYHRDYGIGSGDQFFTEMVQHREFHVAVWMLLYRKSFLSRENIRFVENIVYEDCIFSYQVFHRALKVACVHEYLYHRRCRRNSVMTSQKTAHHYVSAKRAYEEVVAAYSAFGCVVSDAPYVVRIAHNAINNYRALSSSDRKKFRADFKELKISIREHNYYSDKALHASYYGKVAWVLYKISEKLTCH